MRTINNEILADINGRTFNINTSTGEATEMINITVPKGSIWRTPKQQQAAKEFKEAKKRQEEKEIYRRLTKNSLGNFFFVLADNAFANLPPQTVTKLMMLCTYLWYDNTLRLSPKTTMKKSDIQNILRLSKKATYAFWHEIENKYIIERDKKLYIADSKHIFRHKIQRNHKSEFIHYQKIYNKAIRNLYNNISIRKHRQIGYIFKLLPYINLEFNIFCKDPFVSEFKHIEALTIKDLCNLIGYNVTQSSRLLKELQSLKYEHNNHAEYLLSCVQNNSNENAYDKIFLNPHFLYNGSDFKRVEILGDFYNVDSSI